MNRRLDDFALWTHTSPLFRLHGHPYLAFADLGYGSAFVLGMAIAAVFEGTVWWAHLAALCVSILGYETLYLSTKRKLLGGGRSYLQDVLLWVLPSYLGTSVLLGQPFPAALDLIALSLASILTWMRVGCFSGGCCYGRPSTIGTLYNDQTHRCAPKPRAYQPGPRPMGRVFPIQLVSAAFSGLMLLVLLARISQRSSLDGKSLPLLLGGYAVLRFGLERFRDHRHRPVYGPFSEAQWICLGLVPIASAAVYYWPF